MIPIDGLDEAYRDENPNGTQVVTTVACVLFQGEDVPVHSMGVFTPQWVDRLYRGIARNTTRPFRFVCYCDREYEFAEPVERRAIKLPYRNMFSLLEPFADDLGRVLFMGLDTVIVGNIDRLMDYRGPFAMLPDPWHERPCSGVMAFPYTPQVWEAFVAGHEQHAINQTMFGVPSDMIYLATVPHVLLDDTGIYSYKAHCQNGLPEDACIVYFHGEQKPHEVAEDWITEHWGEPPLLPIGFVSRLNTPTRVMIEQAHANMARGLPILDEREPHDGIALIVGGGPSLADTLPDLRMRQEDGAMIFALNGTHDWLISKGVIPDVHVLLDARAENAQFVRNARSDVTYLIAAQCHPDVFDALTGRSVVMWLACFDTPEQENVFAAKHPSVKLFVAGGATVGMKAMHLVHLLGYREQHLFGFDSSYRGAANHAYAQSLNDGESRIEVTAGARKFITAPWMAKQSMEFQSQAHRLVSLGHAIEVHGDGLLPYVAQLMNGESNASHAG